MRQLVVNLAGLFACESIYASGWLADHCWYVKYLGSGAECRITMQQMDRTELSDEMHGPDGQLATGREIIPSEWTDYNGHMNVAYYVVAFDRATDAYKDQVGIDKGYRERTNHSTFAAELHVVYLQEVREGEEVYLTTYLLDWDAKRHHFIHSMWRASDNKLCATMEVMSLHINLEARRTAPWPTDISERLASVHTEHQALPRPEQAGRKASLERRG